MATQVADSVVERQFTEAASTVAQSLMAVASMAEAADFMVAADAGKAIRRMQPERLAACAAGRFCFSYLFSARTCTQRPLSC